jgi:hypothetical protein
MSRSYASITPHLLLLLILAVLVCATPARSQEYVLDDVTLSGGGTLTGFFIYNNAEYSAVSWDITATLPPGTVPPGVVNPLTTTTAPYIETGGSNSLEFSNGPLLFGGPDVFTIYLYWSGPPGLPPDGAPPVTLEGSYEVVSPSGVLVDENIISGTLDPVPLPPSAFLLGSGLLGLAGWRKLKKA